MTKRSTLERALRAGAALHRETRGRTCRPAAAANPALVDRRPARPPAARPARAR